MKFLLDTNFLMVPGKFKVDVFSELTRFGKPELYTLSLVVKELKKAASGKGKDARYAKLGLTLVEKKGLEILPSEGNTDQEIERTAAEQNMVVCTQDRELIRKLKAEEIPVVSLRQKKKLEMV